MNATMPQSTMMLMSRFNPNAMIAMKPEKRIALRRITRCVLTGGLLIAVQAGLAAPPESAIGVTRLVMDEARLAQAGVRVVWDNQESAIPSDRRVLTIVESSEDAPQGSRDIVLRHAAGLRLRGPGGDIELSSFTVRLDEDGGGRTGVRDDSSGDALILGDPQIDRDPVAGLLVVSARELRLTETAARKLGAPELSGRSIGNLVTRTFWDSRSAATIPDQQPRLAGADPACGAASGPDVIVGRLPAVDNYGSVGNTAAFALGTTSCNVGDTELLWTFDSNTHPVIAQNLYRLKDGRFEQVGMSWLKHGFAALTFNVCGCGCIDPGTSQRLGVGCSDPYSSSLNGNQDLLGPRSEVNAHTGQFLYPFGDQNVDGDAIYKRLQVAIADLDPGQDGGGMYFAEGHYVTPDDASAGNADNNASYRQIAIGGAGANWTASFSGMPATVRGAPAIRAWAAHDVGVVETDVRVPGEGLLLLAGKATDLGDGSWSYEYALQNLNSDRSVHSFTVPLATVAVAGNIAFHDVDYHSGEPYDGTDWPGVRGADAVTWSTDSFAGNPNANALRWGSLYNFRFESDAPPQETTVALGLFKPGKPGGPDTVFARTIGPTPELLDCDGDGIDDGQALADGTRQDCNSNALPDACETFDAVRLRAVPWVAGLSQPVAAAAPPGTSDRLFVCEQNTGRIRIVQAGTVLPTPFLDLGGLISTGGERGLLGIAFHPDFASNGLVFVNYTNLAGDTVIARYTRSGVTPNTADAGSAVVLKTIVQDGPLHNGGHMAFGPDGYLYVGMGEGTNGGDPFDRSQDPNSLLGKMLRLDVDAPPAYIPPSNPLVNSNGLDEIWAFGLRNPWRFSFDRLTGDLFIGDNGEDALEEIDYQPAGSSGGENYGWRCYEGSLPFNLAGCGLPGDYDFPLLEYPNTGSSCSVIGGYVYRGCALPQLRGTYFFADFCGGWVRSLRAGATLLDGVTPAWQDRSAELGPIDGPIVSFAEDGVGELYILTYAGTIYRIEPAGPPGACGNGILEVAEQCDDGNTTFGDGCDERCQLEGGDVEVCAGALPLCPDATAVGDTTGAVSDGSATCGAAAGSPTHWYVYTPVADGVATFATCGSDFDTVLSVFPNCPGTAADQLACNDDGCGLGETDSVVTLAVDAGVSYRVRVSGHDGACGAYALAVDGPGCAAVCGNDVVEVGEDCEPPDSPGCSPTCQFNVCEDVLALDDFEAGLPAGWVLNGPGSTALAGNWTVGDPDGTNTEGDFVQPEDAFSGSGCVFTASNASLQEGDVDAGTTWLVSPLYDLSGLDNAKLRYARWYYNGTPADDAGDFFVAEVSDDGGASWNTIELLDDFTSAAQWADVGFELAPLIALTDQVRVRFGVADGVATDDLIEAAVDRVQLSTCTDCNSNGVDDGQDLALGVSTDFNTNGIPDDCEADGDPLRGGQLYDDWPAISQSFIPTEDHPLWAFRPDTSSNDASGLATWLCAECHGWDYRGVDGAFGSGPQRTGFPGIFGTTLDSAELFTLLAESPSNGGQPGVLNGHDLAAYMPLQDIRDLAAFVRIGLVDTTLHIDGAGQFTADPVAGAATYALAAGGPSCAICHGPQGTNINLGTVEEPRWLGNVATDDPWGFLHKVRFGPAGSSMPDYLTRGPTVEVAEMGAYIQQNFPTQCFLDSQCDDGRACNGMETCGPAGCEPGVFTGCDVGCDQDCDIDLADFAFFQRCHTGDIGSGAPVYPPGCDCLDYDGDGDVDTTDHAEFLARISGADVPAAGCALP
jgi:cysteine-rich repeat protein